VTTWIGWLRRIGEPVRNFRPHQRRRLVVHDAMQELRRIVLVRERPARRQHLVHDHAERVDIGARVDVLGIGDLLRRHELRRAHHHVLLVIFGLHEARDTEVEHLDVIRRVVFVGQEHVVALEIAVHDARVVRGMQRRRDLRADPDRAAHRQATDAIDLVGQQRALEVLEHDVRHVIVGEAHVRALDDVRVTERAGRTCLVHESLDDVGVGRELGMQDLDRDTALDQRVLREKDGPHSTRP
jgi:hypothetical protein